MATVTVEDRLQKLKGELLEMSNEKREILKNSKKRFNDLRQCFECLVCKSSTKLPALVSPCCNIVLGCEACVNQWLTANTHCMHCRVSITPDQCSKLPFIRNLTETLRESTQSGTDSSNSATFQVE